MSLMQKHRVQDIFLCENNKEKQKKKKLNQRSKIDEKARRGRRISERGRKKYNF